MQRPLVCISWQIRALEDYFPPNTEREPDPEVEGRGRAGLLADLQGFEDVCSCWMVCIMRARHTSSH